MAEEENSPRRRVSWRWRLALIGTALVGAMWLLSTVRSPENAAFQSTPEGSAPENTPTVEFDPNLPTPTTAPPTQSSARTDGVYNPYTGKFYPFAQTVPGWASCVLATGEVYDGSGKMIEGPATMWGGGEAQGIDNRTLYDVNEVAIFPAYTDPVQETKITPEFSFSTRQFPTLKGDPNFIRKAKGLNPKERVCVR